MAAGGEPRHVDTLIRNGYVVTVDQQRRVWTHGFVAFDDGRIAAVGAMDACDLTADEIVDARGKVVLPGIANAHNHLVQVAFRGYNDDRWPILGSLVEAVRRLSEQLFAFTSRLDEERAYALVRLHLLELTKAGYTATHDEHFTNVRKDSVDGAWAAVRDSGLRALLARCPVDGPNVPPSGRERAEDGLVEVARLRGKFNSDLIEVVPGIINYSWISDPEDMRRLKAGALQMQAGFDIDMTDNSAGGGLRQRGFDGGQVEYYRSFGLLDGDPIYAGKAVGVRPHEFDILAEHDARVAMVPLLRFLDGAGLPIHHLLRVGLLPGLGTDAPLVSDGQSPFQVMRDAILAQNLAVVREKAAGAAPPAPEQWVTAETALEMGTLGGARALLMERETGSLEVGKSADCVVVDTTSASFQPDFDARRLLASLVWSGQSGSVDTVYVAGRRLLAEGRSTIWDEADVIRAAQKVAMDVARESEVLSALPSRTVGASYRGWTYR